MKTKTILLVTLAFVGLSQMNAQIGIGTTEPDPSAVLDVSAEELPANAKKGFLPPRLTTDQRDDIASPAEGLTIYNIDNGCLEFYNGTLWVSACDGSQQPGPLSDCGGGFIAPFITADETEIVDVTITLNGGGTQTWMDRNLGAIAPARAIDDCYAYGNLYQWGRGNDGHENRNSNSVTGPVNLGSEGNNFIEANSGPNNWFIGLVDDDRWGDPTDTDKNTLNDPCPAGYRVPSRAELDDLLSTFSPSNSTGAFGSPLKLPAAGDRVRNDGSIGLLGAAGRYWSSTVSGNDAYLLQFFSGTANIPDISRANGYSVRCIKD
jgi:uncharacterized protein (TIGR02145 family)